jgi:hypothetical protein
MLSQDTRVASLATLTSNQPAAGVIKHRRRQLVWPLLFDTHFGFSGQRQHHALSALIGRTIQTVFGHVDNV